MFEIKIIESGYIMADGGAMFGAIPKRAWSRKYASTDDNLCRLAMRCLLVVSSDRKILVDLGMGDKHIKEMSYYQPHMLVDIPKILTPYGCGTADITDIIITHLHFDHCGYATRRNDNGDIVPSFPNAKYWLSRKQWDTFNNPNRLERDSFLPENILPVYENRQLHFVENDMQLYDGFELHIFDGHTSGQLVPYIKTNDGIITFPGDLIPTAAHVPLEWISAYDVSAETSLNEKERFLDRAVSENFTLIYCHDEKNVCSKVKRLNDNYKATELSSVYQGTL